MDFPDALILLKSGEKVRRDSWKPGRYVWLWEPTLNLGHLSYIELVVLKPEMQRAPWTPSRCDLLEENWEIFCNWS